MSDKDHARLLRLEVIAVIQVVAICSTLWIVGARSKWVAEADETMSVLLDARGEYVVEIKDAVTRLEALSPADVMERQQAGFDEIQQTFESLRRELEERTSDRWRKSDHDSWTDRLRDANDGLVVPEYAPE